MSNSQMIMAALMLVGVSGALSWFGLLAHNGVRLGYIVAVAIFIADVTALELSTVNLAIGAVEVAVLYWALGELGHELAHLRTKNWSVRDSLGDLWPGASGQTVTPGEFNLDALFDVKDM